MSILLMKNKCLLKAACALAFGLTLALTACDDGDKAMAQLDDSSAETPSPAINEDESSPSEESASGYDWANCGQEPNLDCDESYEIDGKYFTNSWCDDDIYYKCENNKWSRLSEGDVPSGDVIVMNPYRSDNKDKIQRLSFKKCNAENEGLVDSIVHEPVNPKYDRKYTYYYKCEQGSWNDAYASDACDTTGVSVGDVCKKGSCYKYLGDGAWDGIECLDLLEKECNAENKGAKEKIVYTNGEDYYVCFNTSKVDDEKNYSWSNDKIEYECFTDTTDFGDVCSVNVSGETKYFQYQYNDYLGIGQWNEGGYDSKLDFCHDDYDEVEFGDDVPGSLISEANGKYFYCDHGEWFSAHIIPQQYSDSRKEGLTDEEYDVLELPKEANVGDRVGGLLEKCFNSESSTETTDAYFCLHQNYYRYREDGTWTLETWDDMLDDPSFDTPDCTPETEGMEWSIPPTSDEPGKIYKRKKVTPWYSDYQVHYDCEEELVEYVFARSEKK